MNDLPEAEALYAGLAKDLASWVRPTSALIGIHTGGAWLAERLHAALGIQPPLGTLDIAFYRDDYRQQGLAKDPKRSQVPFPVEGMDLLLVDDVLHTGRTVRAAMNELFDYGRPASISLAVLVDRGGRELPICAQFCGARIDMPEAQRLRLRRDAAGKLAFEFQRGE